jgi:hypothetical protein
VVARETEFLSQQGAAFGKRAREVVEFKGRSGIKTTHPLRDYAGHVVESKYRHVSWLDSGKSASEAISNQVAPYTLFVAVRWDLTFDVVSCNVELFLHMKV